MHASRRNGPSAWLDQNSHRDKKSTRTETDSFGPIEVPADRYWGAQTERSRQNFRIGHDRMPIAIIHALGIVKLAAAATNRELGLLDQRRASAIARAAREVIDGKLDDHFPLVVWQTGSGTQTNMNLNEVIANRANELLGGDSVRKRAGSSNDHVNMSQSSNDSFPTAMHIAATRGIIADLIPALGELLGALRRKETAFANIVKIGRTHTQDATPLTLGQEFSGYAAQVESGIARLRVAGKDLFPLAQGGTAVGTGLIRNRDSQDCSPNTSPKSPNCPSPALPTNSRRWLPTTLTCSRTAPSTRPRPACSRSPTTSGYWPRVRAPALGELILPENEPGSSIMPGKVNPTQCEAVTMVCCEVFGNHHGHHDRGQPGALRTERLQAATGILYDAFHSITCGCRALVYRALRGGHTRRRKAHP